MATVGTIWRQSAVGFAFLVALAGLLSTPPRAVSAAKSREELDRETESRLKKDVTFLASPLCEGRGPTTRGLEIAANYLAAEFKKIGLRPPTQAGYFQPFATAGAVGNLTLAGPLGQTIDLVQGRQFQPLGLDQAGEGGGGVVFAGYGISSVNPAYDDYAGLDVRDKVVVVLRDTPRANDPERPKGLVASASFLSKMQAAKNKGASAILFVNDTETADDGDTPMDYSYANVARGRALLPAMTVQRKVVEAMLPAGVTLTGIEKAIDRDMKPMSRELEGWTARVEIKKRPDAIPLKNVVGVLEGGGPLADETVVVGAHYDHLGYGGPSSMARTKKPRIHHGADDNGSGTTGMLELARRFAAMPGRQGRRLVFIAFSGEEMGLFGSEHYCKKPLFPLAGTAAMLNLDMIGRLRKDPKTGLDRLLTEGHGTAKPFFELLDVQGKKHGFGLSMKPSGFGPSDHASFCGKKIPVLFLWTDDHPDYHRPTDTADRIDLAGMRRIVGMGEEIVAIFTRMEKPTFIEVPGSKMGRPSSGPRLGIRPGYSADVEGVEVKGVTVGSPADKGGLKDGDLIVGLAGKPVKDLEGYMQAMAVQKKGTTIEVIVVRKKERKTLKVPLE